MEKTVDSKRRFGRFHGWPENDSISETAGRSLSELDLDTLPLDLSQSPNREALEGFLEGCKLRAIEKEHAQLISISVESDLLDPLAVLESIYEPTQPHFYVERPLEGVALAGAEVAVRYTPGGTARFK